MNVPQESLPQSDQQESTPTGQQEKKTPIFSSDVRGSSGSKVHMAIWENEIELNDGSTAVGFAATFHRTFRKGQGEFAKTNSYRLHDLQALQYAVTKAIAWIYENQAVSKKEPEEQF